MIFYVDLDMKNTCIKALEGTMDHFHAKNKSQILLIQLVVACNCWNGNAGMIIIFRIAANVILNSAVQWHSSCRACHY